MNRLATQSSPYLLQHAGNPVDWWPWSPEAIDAARARRVPIFLSIGYSTCYWCHVMERESFENPDIARLLNDAFICIKVDREERPDLDDLYMAATVAMLGHGGWPMNVCLDPETLKPFWCGTYFPPAPARGMPSLPQVIEGISIAWRERHDEVLTQAAQLAQAVHEQVALRPEPVALDAGPVADAVSMLLRMVDSNHGGFGSAPKFPQPVFIDFLLDVRASLDPDSVKAVDSALRLTLDRMMLGGIRDHLAGGFHRYAVDSIWLVPHFEKMLYDQAQLATVYLKAAVIFNDPEYANVARETLDYVLRDLTSPQGLFFSALDAEVDHREGLNYLWNPAEIMQVLGPQDGLAAVRHYGLDKGANFKDPHHADEPARNVLFRADRSAPANILDINTRLLAHRNTRKQPHLDDKILTSWNGLLIAALAQAASILNEPRYLTAARRAADALLTHHRDSAGTLLRTSRNNQAHTPGFLEDYACLIAALLELHHAAGNDSPYLAHAESLITRALHDFSERGILYDVRAEASDLFIRSGSLHDGAMPSGTSVMLHALRQRAVLTGNPHDITTLLSFFPPLSGSLIQAPVSLINATRCLYRLLISGIPEISEALAAIGPAKAPPVRDSGPYPVEIYAAGDRVELKSDTPAVLQVVLRIQPGYHILAADPGPAGAQLFPLRISLTGGSGVQVYADYPEGKRYGPDGELFIYEGQVEFNIVLERQANWSGRPVLTAVFQACSDTECLTPRTVELDVALDRA